MSHSTPATVGIAGVNTRPLHAATLGIAGNWGGTVRPHLEQITARPPLVAGRRLGDRAARSCWAHAAYLLYYTYVSCPDRTTRSLRYRSGFARLCAPETRRLPVYLDSAAYREAAGTGLWFHAGALYRDAIAPVVAHQVRCPLAGLGIGAQLAWYRRHADAAEAPGSSCP